MAKSGYDVFLDKCLLPVTPSKIQMKINNANTTLTLINEGEVSILKKPKLTDIEFECEIPQVRHPYAAYPSGFKSAAYFLNYFENLKLSKKPFQFIVCRKLPSNKKLFNTNIKVSLEDYQITEDAKEGFDLKVKIKLKQYKEFGTKTVNVVIADSKPKATVQQTRSESTVQCSKPIGIGSEVILNGRLHRDSYGNAPGQTRTNYRGKVNFINLKGSHPYHVTTPEGDWLGWVTSDSIKGV